MELLGFDVVLTYAAGELVVRELGGDGRERVRARAADVLGVEIAVFAELPDGAGEPVPHHVGVRLSFCSGDLLVDGEPCRRLPLTLDLPLSVLDAAEELADAVRRDQRESRRIAAPRPGPLAPTRHAALRDDLLAADGRTLQPGFLGDALAVVDGLLRPQEAVLELAPVPPTMALLVTTERVLLVAPGPQGAAHELPLAGVDGFRTERDAYGQPSTVVVDDGVGGLRFHGLHPLDAPRLVAAGNAAVWADKVDGTLAPLTPSSADLFREWQLLVERHRLGMVPTEDYQRLGAAILASLP